MSLLWPPITTPQLWGVIVITFFKKRICSGAREKTNIWRLWCQELWKGEMLASILVNWGFFLQNYELLMGQFSKISNWRNFLEKETNFNWIFYLVPALHKKFSQSLCLSPRNSFGWKFLKLGPLVVHSFARKILNLQEYRLTSLPSTGLNVKAVYEVSNSWYG